MSGFDQLRRELAGATTRSAATGGERVEAGATAPFPGAPTPPRRAPRAPVRWRLPAAGALVLACGILAILAALPKEATRRMGPASVGLAAAAERSCARPAPRHAQSATCLNALGALADAWQVPGTGDVLYLRQWWGTSAMHMGPDGPNTARPGQPGFYMVRRGAEQELWVRPDGSGESLQHAEGPPTFPSPADREAWQRAGRPKLPDWGPSSGRDINLDSARHRWGAGEHTADLLPIGAIDEGAGGPVLLDARDPLAGFSTDPQRLAQQVRRFAWRQRIELSGEPRCALDLHDCEPGTRANIFSNEGTIAVALLRYPLTPRALRAAVLRMLAAQPGYRTIGAARDPRGRRGIAILLPRGSNDGQDVLLIDTVGARLIGVGMSADRTLRTTRWTTLLALETRRVPRVGVRP